MSIQDDNTLATKGDLKNLYTNKIAPYLGGGINYYQCDRSGEELKSGQFALALSTSHGTGTDSTINANAIVPFIMQSGNFELGVTTGTFKVPNGMRIEVDVYTTVTNGATTNCHWYLYNVTDSKEIDIDNGTNLPGAYLYGGQASNYGMSQSATYQWTNNTGKTVEVGVRNMQSSCQVRVDSTGMTVKEIGRIVDPVKYVSNNSDLQETPVGNIISYMGNTVPKHYLACDGTVYNIGSYPELEAFIINEFGSINYFGGDGTTNWAVPDLRGEFLRGSGTNSHTNQGSGGDVGEHQDGTITDLPIAYADKTIGIISSNTAKSFYDYSQINLDSISASNGDMLVASGWKATNYANLASYTSRPTNTSVKYCIKYESTYHAFFSNAAYKVEASFGLNYNSTLQSYVSYAMSYIIGDSSLMDENYFIAPVDGWYMVSFKSNQISYTKPAVQYLQINDVTADAFTDATGSGTSHSNFGVNMTHTIYLSKGDKVNYRVWTNGNTISLPSVRRASFCLLTSNYNPTIVSADTVYSENEQMIGYWTDGKPLYQKVVKCGQQSAAATTVSVPHNIENVDFIRIVGAWTTESGPDFISGATEIIPNINGGSDFMGRVSAGITNISIKQQGGWAAYYVLVIVQYTKTTDTASTLQVENSLLLNRPDLWEVGTEYHFGGGLYGKRISGTMNTTTGVPSYTTIYANFNGNVVSYGGSIRRSVGGNWDFAIPCSYKNGATVMTGGIATQLSGNVRTLVFYFTDSADMSNVPYDVWVTYRK